MIDWMVLNANCTTKRPLVLHKTFAKTLENTDGTIKNGHSRETGNTVHTRQRKTKQSKQTAQHISETTARSQTRMV